MRNFTRLWARCRDVSRTANAPIKIGVVDVPFGKGQGKEGVCQGPKFIRDGGLFAALKEYCENVDIKDYGSITYKEHVGKDIKNMKNHADVFGCGEKLSEKVEDIIKDDRICLTLGGDHSISIGSINGHLKSENGNVGVIWIDAHADINTHKTSGSGNAHGMPLAILSKELSPYWEIDLPDWLNPKFQLKNLCYIGLRSVDPYENAIMHNLGLHYFDMYDVQRYGIHAVVTAALDRVDPHHQKSLHVSFDIDGLDPLEAPSTGTPVRGGLLLREGIHIMSGVFRTGRLGAIDLVEVNPLIGDKNDVNKTVSAAIEVICAAFGANKRGSQLNLEEALKEVKGKLK